MKVGIASAIMLIIIALGMKAGRAEIVDSSFYSFTVKFEQKISTKSMVLYDVFIKDIARWWDPDHTYTGNAMNLSIQPFAGGCFCEKLENNGSIQHMNVLYAAPGKILRLEGGLGPLQQLPVKGILTMEYKTSEDYTTVVMNYTVAGYVKSGLAMYAAIVDKVMAIQFDRYMRYAINRK